jgi:hypothetical protein
METRIDRRGEGREILGGLYEDGPVLQVRFAGEQGTVERAFLLTAIATMKNKVPRA